MACLFKCIHPPHCIALHSKTKWFSQAFVFHHVLGWRFVGLLAAFSRLPLPSLFENRKGTVTPKCQGVIVMFDSA